MLTIMKKTAAPVPTPPPTYTIEGISEDLAKFLITVSRHTGGRSHVRKDMECLGEKLALSMGIPCGAFSERALLPRDVSVMSMPFKKK